MALSRKADKLFEELDNSCDSQALAVKECLKNIAANGEEQEADSYLAGCADEIASWAKYAAKQLRAKK